MGRDRDDSQPQQQSQTVAVVKMEENADKELNIEVLEVVRVAGGGGDEGGGVVHGPVAQSQPLLKPESLSCTGSGNPKKRLRTATILEDVDKKFLLEQYCSERQKNSSLQLQNRVSQLEREMREMERLSTEKEKIHLETLALAETHHRENVLAEIGRLLEAEFNCSICNEVYIEPAVLNCGHTYCSYCINRALQTDFLCPICRTGYNFNPPAKNIEMRNFILKIFQMLPEEMRTTRDQVLQERAALPMPDANASNNRNRTRRRRSRSVSPFDLFNIFGNDDDAFRERRSRSRSVSTLSDSEDSDDESANSFFDLRASPRSPSPEVRPLRSRTRSRSPTGGSGRRRRSPSRHAGLIPLPWRNRLWGSPYTISRTASSRYAAPDTQDRADRRPRQVARRGRALSTGRSYSGTVSGPRRYGWGPPRRQIHSNPNRLETENNNDNPSSSGNNAGHDVGNSMRRRMSVGFNLYRTRPDRWGAPNPIRDTSSTSGAIRSPVVTTPRIPRRSLTLSDNFEDLFSRREPAASPSTTASTSDTTVALNQPLLNHDHSYTTSTANVLLAAIAARTRAMTETSNSQQAASSITSTESSSTALPSGIERLQEQTRRLYSSTNAAAAANRSGTGHLSQALALLAPPSASENISATSATVADLMVSMSAPSSSITDIVSNALVELESEPRRSPRIARQFRHRFLTPTTNSTSIYRESERDRDRDICMREREQNNNSSQSQGSANHSQAQNSQGPSQPYSTQSQDSQTAGEGTGSTVSTVSSTGGTRGSSMSDSPLTFSDLEEIESAAPIDNAGFSAMRRFVHDLHSYRSGPGSGNGREGRDRDGGERVRGENRDPRERESRDPRRNAVGMTGSSRSSRDNRPRSERRSSVDSDDDVNVWS